MVKNLTSSLGKSSVKTKNSSRIFTNGFTIIELIIVIIILGVISVFAGPRIFSSQDFYARGFHDEAMSLMRYAQKEAIAQRRAVCVTMDTSSTPKTIVLRMENPTPVAASMPAVSCGTNLVGPRGESPATVRTKSGVSFTGSSFMFDGLGQPIDSSRSTLGASQVIQVSAGSVAIPQAITVEPMTGYVHDLD